MYPIQGFHEGAKSASLKIEARFGLSMPKNPYNDLLFDHIDGLKFFLISPTSSGGNCRVPGTRQ